MRRALLLLEHSKGKMNVSFSAFESKMSKGKLSKVIKWSPIIFFYACWPFAVWWNLKDIPNSRPNRSKNKLVDINTLT